MICQLLYYLFFLFLTINLSNAASNAGNNNNISIAEHKVPSDKVLHILAAIADAKLPTIRVTITSIDAEVKIV